MGKLARNLGWKTYGLYGLGNIIGAGIYVLIGEVAKEAGNGLIWSFAVAGIVASLTAISYAALATKYPLNAGEVVYSKKAFGRKKLSLLIGLVLVFSGVVSAGVLLNGFANYFTELFDVPRVIIIAILTAIIAAIAIKGIKESAVIAASMTILEVLGLLIILVVAVIRPGFVHRVGDVISGSVDVTILPILFGGFLAFYAFVGFEDMVNVAEEVKDPKRSIKKGMLLAMLSAIVLYMVVGVAALATVPAAKLGTSTAPLATVFQAAVQGPFPLVTIIGLFAIVNGIVAQIIMTSRVLYGLSRERLVPSWFGRVSDQTKTPINATLLISTVILITALNLSFTTLARITSFALLVIFSIVNLACYRLSAQLDVSKLVPMIALALSVSLIVVEIWQWL